MPVVNLPRLLQFNYESTVSYGEDGFSSLSVKGTLEIPLTRSPTQQTRTFQQTADDFRGEIERRVMSGIDLGRFRITRRNFNLSRDKRTLNWDFQAEEKPYMDLPPDCTIARGSYNVRPAKAGMGLCQWLCSLRVTYIVRADRVRRTAWVQFLTLLRFRMAQSSNAPNLAAPVPRQGSNPRFRQALRNIFGQAAVEGLDRINPFNTRARREVAQQNAVVAENRRAFLMDFSFDEGMYLDSKTVTFNATWKIICPFSHILLASGLWTKVEGGNRTLWASSIRDVSGAQSWLPNKADTDIIVDFGGG